MTYLSLARTVRPLPVPRPTIRRVALAVTVAAGALTTAAPLAAQLPLTIAPDSAVAVRVTTRVASSAPLSPVLAQEIYVAAFRSSARQWCAAGSATGLDDALAGTRSIVQTGVAEADRAGVERALVEAHGELSRAGGCAGLARPTTRVVVDRFEGHPWNAPRKAVTRDRGVRSEGGYTVVTRKAKIGTRRSHRVSAEAEFTFTTQREELVRGRYRVPAASDNVAERWETIESTIAERYPMLRVVRSGGAPRPATYAAHDPQSDGATSAATGVRHWATAFMNPDTQAIEVRIFTTPAGEDPNDVVIVVDYLGFSNR